MEMNEPLDLQYPKSNPTIIKVVGVGGGGGNAVNHMYKEGIQDVSFALCNTDNQALLRSPIPRKIQLGRTVTEGLGAGNRPMRAREAAEESIDEISALFDDGTKMVFITAGMGGGTGTGAAPVIARVAKEKDILTVGIVTIPFLFEGEKKILQALDGVEEMSQYVDALLVINNERLRQIYPDLHFLNAFGKADDTLTTAAKSIAEIITVSGYINLDFADVNSILKDGGVAIMSSGFGQGERRVAKAIEDALNSPLLNNNDVFGAKKVLFNLYFNSKSQLKMEEMSEVHDFMLKFGKDVEVIWGAAVDETLDDNIKIIILATGFGISNLAQASADKTKNETKTVESKKIETMYGDDSVKDLERAKARASFVILTPEQMDDDLLLDLIDKSPTYNREPQFLSKIQHASVAPVEPPAETPSADGVIRF